MGPGRRHQHPAGHAMGRHPTAPGSLSRTEMGSALAASRHLFEAGPCKNGSQQTMVGPIITWRHLRYRRDAMGRGMVTA